MEYQTKGGKHYLITVFYNSKVFKHKQGSYDTGWRTTIDFNDEVKAWLKNAKIEAETYDFYNSIAGIVFFNKSDALKFKLAWSGDDD